MAVYIKARGICPERSGQIPFTFIGQENRRGGYISAAALLDSQSEKYTGLPMAVKPSMPVITTLLYPLAQWMMSRLPLSSLPPTMPTWLSPG